MNTTLLIHSLVVAGSTALLAGLLGFLAALAVICLPRAAQRVVIPCVVACLALPSFVVTNCWLDLMGVNGVLRSWLPFPIFSLTGTVFVLTLLNWAVPFLLAWSAWQKVDQAQVEADPALRGAALVRWVFWPAAKGPLIAGAAIAFVLALNNFAVPSILQVKVLAAEVWVAFNTNLDAVAALKAGWPLIGAPALLIGLLFPQHKVDWPRLGASAAGGVLRKQLGRGPVIFCALIAALLLAASMVAPLAQLAFSQRTWTEFVPALIAGLSAIGNSVGYAGAASVLAIAAGLWLWRLRLAAGLWLLFLVPGVLLGIGLISTLNRPSLSLIYPSALIVILAFTLRYIAVAHSASRLAMQDVDRDLVEMVQLSGASGWRLFWHATWPQVRAPAAIAAYLVYLLCLWDVETLILIVPPGGETLALRIFNLLHYGHSSHVNALCFVLLLVALAPLLIGGLLRRISHGALGAAALVALLGITGCSNRLADGRPRTELHSSIFSHVEIIGERGTAPGQFNKPRSIALDTNDNLFVVDMTGRVQKFSPDGKYLLSWQMPQTELGKPKGMDRDRDGNIVVLEPHYQRLNFFSPEGKLLAQWGHKGTNAGELILPRSVAVDSKGDIIVPEYTLAERVQKFNKRGELLKAWGKSGLGPGEFNRPEGVGVDAQDRIYVADSCNHRIQVFSPEGKFLRAYGKPGTGTNEFDYPYDIRLDREGRQYVCEFGNSRIQIFDANDRAIEIIGHAGALPGEFFNPWTIAFDSKGNLYVVDSQNHRVQKLVRRKPYAIAAPERTFAAVGTMGHDTRPKSEGSRAFEYANHGFDRVIHCEGYCGGSTLLYSDFGFGTSFGFRISDFGSPSTSPFRLAKRGQR